MKKLLVFLFAVIILLFFSVFIYYKNNIKAVGGNKEVSIEIVSGDTYNTISSKLKQNNLIKSELVYKIYIKINKPDELRIGSYKLNTNMDLEKILKELSTISSYNPDVIKITFKEGLNIRGIANVIEENTGITKDSVIDKVKDKEYIRELMTKYWFLKEDILDSKIYYPLEGYLFPSTYEIYKNSSVENILEKMLDQTEKILSEYKTEIEQSEYSIHEIMTLASLVELEGKGNADRKLVASVFHNRIKDNWTLGSDVTTYYGCKIDDFKTSLYKSQLNDCSNGYNTRGNCRVGLPVGPIANSGEYSIIASINIEQSNYYYFVADCNGKVYFNQTITGHNNTISKLKGEGNWCS